MWGRPPVDAFNMSRQHAGLRRALVFSLFATLLVVTAGRSEARQATAQVRSLIEEGSSALQERRFEAALEAFSQATSQQPGNSQAWLGQGIAQYMMGRNEESQVSLKRALSLNPQLLTASLVLGQLQYSNGQLADAVATLEAAQKFSPSEPRLAEALEKWRAEARLESRFYESRGAHFRVLFEGPSDDALARRVADMLEQAYWMVGGTLSSYPTGTIDVVLYTREQFRDVTRSPFWAAAAYDGRVRVPTHDALARPGELERLLVHELVHAFVADLGGRSVPTWLNEGLAVALEPGGLDQSEATLAATQTRIPLRALRNGFSNLRPQNARIAYAESAVAVRRMFDLRGTAAVVALLKDIAGGADFDAAFQQRIFISYAEFEQLVGRL